MKHIDSKEKVIIGRAERMSFPAQDIVNVPAKIDTGAYRSSIWASNIKEQDGNLSFRLFGPKSPFYTGKDIIVSDYELVEVESSFGHKQKRYCVHITVEMNGRKVRAIFTLANRAMKTYPILVGRRLLRNKFIVDVSKGSPIPDEEDGSKERDVK